ncbi:MAG: tetratricopeptide repeat protein, partial [Fidelibacterota bacterium]
MPKRSLGVLLVFTSAFSCAYFNTFYNARRYFDEAEKDVLKTEDRSKLKKKTMDALEKTVEKTTAVLEKYPGSRFWDDALLLRGKAQFYQGEYLKAQGSFERLIREAVDSPLTVEAELWLMRCRWKLGLGEAALSGLSDLIERAERRSGDGQKRGYLALGNEMAAEIYRDEGEIDSAVYHYERAIEHLRGAQERSRIYFKIAELSASHSRYESALTYYEKVIRSSKNPKHVETAHLEIVRIMRIQERWDEAITQIQALLSNDKFSDIRPDLYLELAKLYEMQNRTREAMNRYELITEEFPRTLASAEAYFQMGQLTVKTSGDYAESEKYFKKVERESRSSIFSPSAKIKVKEVEAIMKVVREIEQLEKMMGEARSAIAAGETETEAETTLVAPPDSSDALSGSVAPASLDTAAILGNLAGKLYSYGELLAFHFDQPDSGISVFERLVDQFPQSSRRAQAFYSLMHLYELSDDFETAEARARQLVDEYPLTEYAERASFSLGLEMHDEAEAVLEQAEKISVENPREAIHAYERIVTDYPSSRFVPNAMMALALTYDHRMNDLEESLAWYELLLTKFPTTEQARFVRPRYSELKQLQASHSENPADEGPDTTGESLSEKESSNGKQK